MRRFAFLLGIASSLAFSLPPCSEDSCQPFLSRCKLNGNQVEGWYISQTKATSIITGDTYFKVFDRDGQMIYSQNYFAQATVKPMERGLIGSITKPEAAATCQFTVDYESVDLVEVHGRSMSVFTGK